MFNIKTPNNINKKRRLPLLLVSVLLVFHDSLAFGLFGDENFVRIFLFFMVIGIFVYLLVIKKSVKVNIKSEIAFMFLLALLVLNMLINQDSTLGYFYIIMLMTMAFVSSQMISFEEFVEASIQCMFFLAIYSIGCYMLRPIIFNFSEYFPYFYNASGLRFFHLGASVILDNPSYYRLFGIFREPGVYQMFLNIAIILELFARKNNLRISYISVFILTVFLTFSTPGYFGTFAILSAYILLHRRKIAKGHLKEIGYAVLLVLVVIGLVFLINPNFLNYFESALSKFFNRESSFIGRRTSLYSELKLWIESPLFGYGITRGIELSRDYGSNLLGEFMFNTSTFSGLLVTLGVGYFLVFVALFVKTASRLSTNFLVRLVILSTLVFLLSSQFMVYNAYLYAFIFFGLSRTTNFQKTGLRTDFSIEASQQA